MRNSAKNHTGSENNLKALELLQQASKEFPPDVRGNSKLLAKERMQSYTEASCIGMIPPIKGDELKLSHNRELLELFLDKLGERLAFERTGVRLYEAALAKFIALKASKAIIKEFEHIKNEEHEHMMLVAGAIKFLGGDPTAMTPCADISGVMGLGLIQIVSDPRANLAQTLEALLNVELIDNSAWELLISLARENRLNKICNSFKKALAEEEEHLEPVFTI